MILVPYTVHLDPSASQPPSEPRVVEPPSQKIARERNGKKGLESDSHIVTVCGWCGVVQGASAE